MFLAELLIANARIALARRILSFAVVALAGASLAHGQVMRASCDNRSGTAFADVIDTSDANQNGYNVDPSEIFRSYAEINYGAFQMNGNSSATANVFVNSKFYGANPGVATSGFRLNNYVNATGIRGTLPVLAFANDNSNVCIEVSGASGINPLRMRAIATIAKSGGATAQVRVTNPSGTQIFNATAVGQTNRPLVFFANGTYNFYATTATGNVQPAAGIESRAASIYGALVCLADYDGSGTLNILDIFDYLTAWFAGSPSADSDLSGSAGVNDIFIMLRAWFAGCPG